MSYSNQRTMDRESLILRIVWMLVFFFVWQLAELLLLGIVIVQLLLKLVKGEPSIDLMGLGDSVSQYIAQIGRFGTFNTEQKPWPMADWPRPRAAEVENPASKL